MNYTEKDIQNLIAQGTVLEAEGLDDQPTALNQQLQDSKQSEKKQVTADLLHQIDLLGLPKPETEYQFWPDRKFAFDLAWPELGLACEIEGGRWLKTSSGYSKGHAHPIRFESDCIKYSEAAIRGWLLIRVLPEWCAMADGTAIDLVSRAIAAIQERAV